MSLTQTSPGRSGASLSVQPQRKKRMVASASGGKCLVVSPNKGCLEGMKLAAAGAQWDCVPCSQVEDSLRQAFLHRFGLAIVDVGSIKHRRVLTDLLRLVVGSGNGLAIAYDKRGDPATELWARENGAWLYVPGEADWDNLSTACREAGRVYEQLRNRDALGVPV